MRTSIWLKFSIRIGRLKVNTNIKFGVKLVDVQGGIIDFTRKAVELLSRPQGNRFEEQADWHGARLNIRGVSWWLEIDQVRDNRDMKLNPILVKITRLILHN